MPPSYSALLVNAIRAILLACGIAGAIFTLYQLLTIPPAPPGSDGFITGLAYLVFSILFITALGVTCLGIVLPALLGADDPLGFNRLQRTLLKATGGGLLLGLVGSVVVSAVTVLELGVIALVLVILGSVFITGLVLAWRGGEVAYAFAIRVLDRDV